MHACVGGVGCGGAVWAKATCVLREREREGGRERDRDREGGREGGRDWDAWSNLTVCARARIRQGPPRRATAGAAGLRTPCRRHHHHHRRRRGCGARVRLRAGAPACLTGPGPCPSRRARRFSGSPGRSLFRVARPVPECLKGRRGPLPPTLSPSRSARPCYPSPRPLNVRVARLSHPSLRLVLRSESIFPGRPRPSSPVRVTPRAWCRAVRLLLLER